MLGGHGVVLEPGKGAWPVEFREGATCRPRRSSLARASCRTALGATVASLDGMKPSVGEAMSIGRTLAAAYRKAFAGVGFRLEHAASRSRGRASVVLAASEGDASDRLLPTVRGS